nr:MAG TPA: hypothetical protein [Caudoviricetes sp.]
MLCLKFSPFTVIMARLSGCLYDFWYRKSPDD